MSTIMARPREDFEAAVRSDAPFGALRNSAQRLLGQGMSRHDVLALLEDFRSALRVTGRREDEEVVMDVMDAVTGWTTSRLAI